MNSFLAREIVIRLILSCIVIVIPTFVALKKIFPALLHLIDPVKNFIQSGYSNISETVVGLQEKRKLAKEKKTARDEAIRVAQQAQTETEKDIDDSIQVQLPDHTQLGTKEEKDEPSDKTEEFKPSYEQPIRPGSKGVSTQRSEADQQKFQKQLESIKFAALTYKERGKPQKYEQKLIEGLSLQQDNQEFMNMLANHYFSTGNNVKALTLLKKIVTVETKNHKAIWQIGRIYQTQNKSEAAQLLIEKALEQKPDHPKYLISLVEVHYEKGEKRAALEIMERLRKLRPTNIDYLLTVATLHEELNEPTFARNYYMKILEINPHNEHAKNGLKGL